MPEQVRLIRSLLAGPLRFAFPPFIGAPVGQPRSEAIADCSACCAIVVVSQLPVNKRRHPCSWPPISSRHVNWCLGSFLLAFFVPRQVFGLSVLLRHPRPRSVLPKYNAVAVVRRNSFSKLLRNRFVHHVHVEMCCGCKTYFYLFVLRLFLYASFCVK